MGMLLAPLGLILLGVAMRMGAAMYFGARGPSPNDAAFAVLRVLSWALILLPLFGFIPIWGGPGALLLGLLAFALMETRRAKRERERRAAWRFARSTLFWATAEPHAFSQLGRRFTGRQGRAFRQFMAQVRAGTPWVQAVCDHRAAFPRMAPLTAVLVNASSPVLGARQSESSAVQPAASYRELGGREATHGDGWTGLDEHSLADQLVMETRQQFSERLLYLVTVGLAAVGILIFIHVKILPSFPEILSDFEVEAPIATQAFQGLGGVEGSILASGFVFCIACLFIIIGLALIFPKFDALLGDWIWLAPHRAYVLRLMALIVRLKLPLPEALCRSLQTAATNYPPLFLRSRLVAVLERMEAGESWIAALQAGKFLNSRDVSLLEAAAGADHASWTLRLLAEQKLRACVYRRRMWQQIFYGAALLTLAVLVAWCGIAVIQPLSLILLESA